MEPRPESPVKSFVVPAPTKGLNYKQAYPFMDPDTAISMSNLIPNGATVDVRGGASKYTEIVDGRWLEQERKLKALMTYNTNDGNSFLIGWFDYWDTGFNYLAIYNLSTSTPVLINSAVWSPTSVVTHVNFGNNLFFCSNNGGYVWRLNKPSGSGYSFVASDLTYQFLHPSYATGATYSCIGSYKRRLYMAEGSSNSGGSYIPNPLKIWYGNTDQISTSAGAITATNFYDASGLFERGGQLIFVGSVTRQEGALSENLFAAITDQGEMCVFQGSYPGSATWEIVGRYIIPTPMGRRAFFYIGSALYIITQSGIYSFTELTSNYQTGNSIAFTSDYINNKFPDWMSYTIGLVSTHQNAQAVGACFYPKENKIFINFPETQSTFSTLVQDLTTKGWGKLDYRNPIYTTTVYKNELIGGSNAFYTFKLQSGIQDDVYTISTDKWTTWPISYSAQIAANYNDDFSVTKQFNEIKALVQCTSPYSITAGLTVDFDLRSCGTTNYSKMTGGTYGLYQPRFNAGDRENVGKCCILNIGGQAGGADLPMKFIAFEVYYTTGGNW